MNHTNKSAVSPVVGVILIVAITVALSATIGVFVFNLGDSLSSGEPTRNTAFSAAETAVAEDGNTSVQSFVGDSSRIEEFEYVIRVDGQSARISNVQSDGTYTVSGDSTLVTTPHKFSDGGLDEGRVNPGDSALFKLDTSAVENAEDVSITVVHAPTGSQVVSSSVAAISPAGTVAGPGSTSDSVLLSDGFDDGDFTSNPAWTETGDAGFYVDSDGHLRTPNTDGDSTLTTTVSFTSDGNYTWTLDQRLTTLDKWQYSEIHLMYADANNRVTIHMHEEGSLRLEAVEGGVTAAQITPGWGSNTNWHTLRVEKNGDEWELFLDGTPKGTITYTPPYDAGQFAVTSVSGCCGQTATTGHEYDNVTVVARD